MDMQRSLIAFDNIFPDVSDWDEFLRDIHQSVENGLPVYLSDSRLSRLLLDSLNEAFPRNSVMIDIFESKTLEPAYYIFKDHPLLSYKPFSSDMWQYKLGVFKELMDIRTELGLKEDAHFVETDVNFSRHRDHAMLLALFELNSLKVTDLLAEVQKCIKYPWYTIVIRGGKVADQMYETMSLAFANKLNSATIGTEQDAAAYKLGEYKQPLLRVLDSANLWMMGNNVKEFVFSETVPLEVDISFKPSVWQHKLELFSAGETFVKKESVIYDTKEWYL